MDPKLLGYIISERKVTPISERLILLTDLLHTPQNTIEKQKLVHLYPDKLSWVLTHITGPTKHSQFRYEIITNPNGCHLNYEALHIEQEKDTMTSEEKLQLTKTLCKKDSDMWQLLATAMEQELNNHRP
jgi:hypothetical protein